MTQWQDGLQAYYKPFLHFYMLRRLQKNDFIKLLHTFFQHILYNLTIGSFQGRNQSDRNSNSTRVGTYDLVQDVNELRLVLLTAGAATAAAATYYLYQRQLGAIPFFLLSIFFFYLAYTQLSKKKKNQRTRHQEVGIESEKSDRNDR